MNKKEQEEFFSWMRRIESITARWNNGTEHEVLGLKEEGDGFNVLNGNGRFPCHWKGRIRCSKNPELLLRNEECGELKTKVPQSTIKRNFPELGDVILEFQIKISPNSYNYN